MCLYLSLCLLLVYIHIYTHSFHNHKFLYYHFLKFVLYYLSYCNYNLLHFFLIVCLFFLLLTYAQRLPKLTDLPAWCFTQTQGSPQNRKKDCSVTPTLQPSTHSSFISLFTYAQCSLKLNNFPNDVYLNQGICPKVKIGLTHLLPSLNPLYKPQPTDYLFPCLLATNIY